jgi:hypothetical protein
MHSLSVAYTVQAQVKHCKYTSNTAYITPAQAQAL